MVKMMRMMTITTMALMTATGLGMKMMMASPSLARKVKAPVAAPVQVPWRRRSRGVFDADAAVVDALQLHYALFNLLQRPSCRRHMRAAEPLVAELAVLARAQAQHSLVAL